MSFILDKLVAVRNSVNHLISIDGFLNLPATGTTPPYEIDAQLIDVDKDLIVSVTGTNPGRHIHFDRSAIDFAGYGRRDMLTLVLEDADSSLKKELGGICIRDTDYPPPYRPNTREKFLNSPHKTFSAQFAICKIEIIRQASPNNKFFKVNLYIDFFSTSHEFTFNQYLVKPDTARPPMEALVIGVNATPTSNGGTGSFSCQNLLIELGKHNDRGLPIIITDSPLDNINWNDISTKKALIYAE